MSSHFHPDRVRERVGARMNADLRQVLHGLPPSLAKSIAGEWRARIKRDTLRDANLYAVKRAAELHKIRLPIGLDDDELRLKARELAKAAALDAGSPPEIVLRSWERVPDLMAFKDAWNKCRLDVFEGLAKRVQSERWWRRQLRRETLRAIEVEHVRMGDVHRKRDVYLKDESFARLRARQRAAQKSLQNAVATNESGLEMTVAELAARSVSNPAIRRTELMVRVRGMEEIADSMGWVGLFVTITAPSRYHPSSRKYDGHSPRDTHDLLMDQWKRTRAMLGKLGIERMGVRVVEPHHDGAPHWHMLLWCDKRQRGALVRILRRYARETDKHEPGAWKHRFTVKHIDRAKGSAVGYIAKYLSKNIDGHAVGTDDESGLSAESGAERVKAWANLHRVRQFQIIGAPSVTVWRQLRKAPIAESQGHFFLHHIHVAADIGDWSAYTRAVWSVGGQFKLKTEPLRNWVNTETGETALPRNCYGEEVKVPCAVVILDSENRTIERVLTRRHEWTVEWHGKAEGRAAWTRVNNCNSPEEPHWQTGDFRPAWADQATLQRLEALQRQYESDAAAAQEVIKSTGPMQIRLLPPVPESARRGMWPIIREKENGCEAGRIEAEVQGLDGGQHDDRQAARGSLRGGGGGACGIHGIGLA
ncbi:replication endonuclease [Chitinilyticum aquatile]|uniref:replication endonuclease n=1 Tax=Chitinilyticum aquatile TaxID=362520 RepID=UPI000419913D|nr:replication endonuclease [Chitinilyticum aquatile]